ncbi:MAG: bifunctional hydroxymethylpyrimidine kinase/phosphomethylpyrimidine kinase [Eubacterium sp.]|nr:bifunctional hydroxymethylpyrimidine kinase/phosphomethylpyrimidine kinase [Eubacterium sp.]
MHTALTIAGSDSSGGAGIQADIKTMMANGVFAMSAITSLTAQNTTGVSAVLNVTPSFLGEQLDQIFTDIFPDAVKIGMVSQADLIRVISDRLQKYRPAFVVVDPVMAATSGAKLISDDAVELLQSELMPRATLVTPNIPEAEVLSGMHVQSREDMCRASEIIHNRFHCAVLCKGGHLIDQADDLLFREGSCRWFHGERICNENTHGTGCTLSSAIAANLAKGFDLETSVERAKEYISGALSAMLDLGKGSGPMNHAFAFSGRFMEDSEGNLPR